MMIMMMMMMISHSDRETYVKLLILYYINLDLNRPATSYCWFTFRYSSVIFV